MLDKGDPLWLAGLALREVDIRYLGGVTYVVPGVAGGVAVGSKPRRARCVGVRGISERSSVGRKRGYKAMMMLATKNSRISSTEKSAYRELLSKNGRVLEKEAISLWIARFRFVIGKTHLALRVPPKTNVVTKAPPFQRTLRRFLSLKVAAFWRRTISFN